MHSNQRLPAVHKNLEMVGYVLCLLLLSFQKFNTIINIVLALLNAE